MGRRIGVLILIGVLAAACSDSGAAPSDSTVRGPLAAGDPSAPLEGGVLRIGVAEVGSLDPIDVNEGSALALLAADLVFDGLTDLDESGKAVPALAEAWSASPAGKVWEFELAPNARFADGSAVTPADVEYTLTRIMESDSLMAGRLRRIEGVRRSGRSTVEIRLTAPVAALPELLAAPSLGIVPKDQVEEDAGAFGREPAGSGPFGNVMRTGGIVTLAAAPAADTHVDAVELVELAEASAAWVAFEAGDIDIALVPEGERAETIVSTPFRASMFFGVNVTHLSLRDMRFRQALLRAVDNEAIVAEQLEPGMRVADRLDPDGTGSPCFSLCDGDIDAASAMRLEALDGRAGPELHIDFPDGAEPERVAAAVRENLRAAGFDAELRPHPPDEYADFLVSGRQEIFLYGTVAVDRSGGGWIQEEFTSNAPDNVTGLEEEAVDQAMATATVATANERTTAWELAEAQVLARGAAIPIGRYVVRYGVGERVQDLAVDVDGTIDAAAAWLADE